MKLYQTMALVIAFTLASGAGAQTSVRDATSKEIAAIRKAMERDLLDAESARFDSVKVKGEDMCGLVNAKNSMGAYVGYRAFNGMIFKDTTGKLLAAPMGMSGSEEVTRTMCAQKGIPLPP
ncbi:MAG: hypothetical protein ACREO8_09130 [Luteimonas sp.]